jgi:hypothetical protein
MPKFLGFETMSREDHLRAGLFGLVLLSLECVLAGLVTGAELRGWIVHALAAGLGIWAMIGVEPLPVRASAATAIVAVANEAVMYVDNGQSMKYIVPAFLLLGTAIWILERSISGPGDALDSSGQLLNLGGDAEWAETAASLDFPPPPPRVANYFWAPIVSVAGIGMALYGFLWADWITTRAFFGFIRADLSYSDLRGIWNDFGAPSPIAQAYVGVAYVLGYVGMLLTLVGSVSALVKPFVVERPWRVAGVATIGTTALMQLVVVVGLLAAKADISVLSGAWAAPLGLGLATLGFWVSTAK